MLASACDAFHGGTYFAEEKEAWGTHNHSFALLSILSGLNDSILRLANRIFLVEE